MLSAQTRITLRWTGSAPTSALPALAHWLKPPEGLCPLSLSKAEQTVSYRWMLCKNFVCRLLLLHRSSDELQVDRFRLSHGLERMIFTARCLNIFGMTCWTPMTGSTVIRTILPSQ